jgi:hypothetical protein
MYRFGPGLWTDDLICRCVTPRFGGLRLIMLGYDKLPLQLRVREDRVHT